MSSPEKMLREIISHVLLVDKAQIHDKMTRKEMEEWDSLSHLMLISEIETVFEIVMSDDDIMNVQSVGDLKMILRKLEIKV